MHLRNIFNIIFKIIIRSFIFEITTEQYYCYFPNSLKKFIRTKYCEDNYIHHCNIIIYNLFIYCFGLNVCKQILTIIQI